MRISWGQGLIIFFILYIGYLVGTVIKSTSVVHNLVVEDYYDHDIAYQELYVDATENRKMLVNDLGINIDREENLIHFQYAKNVENLKGLIHFYRPSDKQQDERHEFQLQPGEVDFSVPTDQLIAGKWIVKIRWSDGTKEYYKEEQIII